ncbi:hypothetical protein SPW_7478 [Streptomyces sp. W007]|nr:hypothetical protein SPW_7478 [Streptomyces sp. W007]
MAGRGGTGGRGVPAHLRGPDRGPVPLPTTGQGAMMDLVGAGDEVAACWRRDPQ